MSSHPVPSTTEAEELFLRLIRISVGTEAPDGFSPAPHQWKQIYRLACKHSVLSSMSTGLNSLETTAPLELYSYWMLSVEDIQECNAEALDKCRQLCAQLSADGLKCCVLKGLGNATYYPDPTLRQCGDLDIWVDGDREMLLEYFRKRYKTGKVCYHHFDVEAFPEIEVEVHTRPSWMNSYRLNRKLGKLTAALSPGQFANFKEDLGFAIPTVSFSVIHSVLHIYRHCMSEGIGIRHLEDLYWQLLQLPSDERETVMKSIAELGLGRFTAALMYVLEYIFSIAPSYLLCKPDPGMGAGLFRDVLCGGNFGRYGKHYRNLMDKSPMLRIPSRLWHTLKHLHYCPADAFAAPFFKIWQKIFISRRYGG